MAAVSSAVNNHTKLSLSDLLHFRRYKESNAEGRCSHYLGKMEMVPRIHIETLTEGSNWVTWKYDILFTLCLLDYQSVLSKVNTSDATLTGKDAVVKFIIETSVGSELKERLSSCTSAKAMWDKLVAVYEPDTENVFDIFTDIYEFSKNSEDSFAANARKLRKVFKDLNVELKKAKKMLLPQSFLLNKIIKSLPAEYSEFLNDWEKIAHDQRNVKYLIEQLRLYEQQRKGSSRKKKNDIRAAKESILLDIISTGTDCDEVKDDMPIVPYTCEKCCKTFDDKKKYKNHVRRIHKDKTLSCSICDMKFTFLHKLKIHERSHSVTKVYQVVCSLCGKGLSRGDKLRYHIFRYHTENNSTRTESRYHVKIPGKKRVKIEKMSEEQLSKFAYKCDKCMVGYHRRGILVNHMAKHHPETPLDSIPCLKAPIFEVQKSFKCHYCWKTYMSHGKRKSHIKNNHPESYLPVSSRYIDIHDVGTLKVDPRKCSLCPKQFLKNAKLLQHVRKEHPLIVFENENELVA